MCQSCTSAAWLILTILYLLRGETLVPELPAQPDLTPVSEQSATHARACLQKCHRKMRLGASQNSRHCCKQTTLYLFNFGFTHYMISVSLWPYWVV